MPVDGKRSNSLNIFERIYRPRHPRNPFIIRLRSNICLLARQTGKHMKSIARYVKKHTIYSGALLFIVIFLTTSRPNHLPAIIVASVVAAIIVLLFGCMHWLVVKLVANPFRIIVGSVSATAIFGLLIILQVTGQLTLRDFIGSITLFIVGWLYITRFSLNRTV